MSGDKIFSKCNEYDSWLQSKFNILSFKLNKFDMKQEILFSGATVNQVVNKYLNS